VSRREVGGKDWTEGMVTTLYLTIWSVRYEDAVQLSKGRLSGAIIP